MHLSWHFTCYFLRQAILHEPVWSAACFVLTFIWPWLNKYQPKAPETRWALFIKTKLPKSTYSTRVTPGTTNQQPSHTLYSMFFYCNHSYCSQWRRQLWKFIRSWKHLPCPYIKVKFENQVYCKDVIRISDTIIIHSDGDLTMLCSHCWPMAVFYIWYFQTVTASSLSVTRPLNKRTFDPGIEISETGLSTYFFSGWA